MESPALSAHVQLCLEVNASDPDNPVAELKLDIGDSKRPLPPTWQRVEAPRAMVVEKLPPNRTYWLSFDRWNQRVKYGRGYHMEQTTEKTWDFKELLEGIHKVPSELTDAEREDLFGPGVKLVTLTITRSVGAHLPGAGGGAGMNVGDAAAVVEFDPLPLVKNPPAVIKDSSRVTLDDMDDPKFTFSADLPAACQVLYKNISGIELDQDVAAAIKYSIETEGLTLYKKLWKKKFGEDWKPTDRGTPIDNGTGEFPYLRVTLGAELGDGPGIPYVLEIWPGRIGKSPIHNHGNVCAVIKVLHGSINVSIYNKLELKAAKQDPSRASQLDMSAYRHLQPLFDLPTLKKGDVTWMSPHWYQCHVLDNTASQQLGDYCATIQCYKYDDQDPVRWSGFDFIEGDGINLFVPDSDFTYGYMKLKVLEEYKAASTKG